ncbi:MAG: hypothetical protein ACI8UD_000104 [Planctomycetota bacterium]
MTRKTSDIAMLLGSSSKSRSKRGQGLTGKLVGFIDSMLGRKSKRGRRQERREQTVPMLVFGVAVLLAFGGGYAIGGGFGNSFSNSFSNNGDGANPLRAQGRAPTFVDEVATRPLAAEAFIVSVYPGVAAAEAKELAQSLSKYLTSKGLAKVRPYPWPQANGTLWVVAVYFDGEAEASKTKLALEELPMDVPDEMFCTIRKTDAKSPTGWPGRVDIPNQ